MLVLYGTETGTAHDLAEQLWREAYRRQVIVRIFDFDEYNLNDLPTEKFVVFIVSTGGHGEMPSNMRINWRKLLNSHIPSDWAYGLRVACFGLGDSSYQCYNYAAKKIARRLIQLGATMSFLPVYGDDQNQLGPYGSFDIFCKTLWTYLYANSIFPSITEEPSREYPRRFNIIFNHDVEQITTPESSFKNENFVAIPCTKNERVTSPSHFQDTRLISFGTKNHEKQFLYKPGDVLMIQPRNLTETIKIASEALGYTEDDLNRKFFLLPTDKNIATPPRWLVSTLTTLKQCLNVYFDLQMIPRRSFFNTLALYSTNKQEKERLLEFADMNNLDEYLDYCQRPRRTVAETLRDFPNSARHLEPSLLFELFTPIRPRAFSIASSPSAHPHNIELLVARVEYKAIQMQESRRGLCSNFLANLKVGNKVFVKVRPGTFRFASNVSRLLIGPGTGIAPFRSLVAELDVQQNMSKTLIFFGCRSSKNDFYFSKEWQNYSNCVIVTAFSRPIEEEEKSYVQDKIVEHAEQVWQILEHNNSQIFIAGRAKDMPDAVVAALKSVAVKCGDVENPDEFMKSFEQNGRIQFETWD